MKKSSINFLTVVFLFASWNGQILPAPIVTQEEEETHLRWSMFVPKDQVLIQKNGKIVSIKSLNEGLISSIYEELKKIPLEKDYIKSISDVEVDQESNVNLFKIELTNEKVELFSFYRDEEKKYILDYWYDRASLITSSNTEIVSEVSDERKKDRDTKEPKRVVKSNIQTVPLIGLKSTKEEKRTVPPIKRKKEDKEKQFRDFRYGASFVWDYPPLVPGSKREVELSRKTAEFFYPIKDRDFRKDDNEAHLQLAINLYRRKKWGLMYKAVGLYQEKYGQNRNTELIEYLKANALIREGFERGEIEPSKEGIIIYENLAEMSSNYEFKKSLLKYLINYYFDKDNYVSALRKAKNLYTDSRENFDYEEFKGQAKNILYSLAKLKQIDRIKEVLKDKMIAKFVPSQFMLAYEIYTLVSTNNIEGAINLYERKKASLASPVEASILYNVGESYFRNSQYKKAVPIFDEFITSYSFYSESSNARLRIAMSYDFLDRPEKQIQRLYKDAIDRASTKDISYEARIRYVGFSSVRNKNPTEKDVEERIFLDRDEGKKFNDNINQLLWLVRLRTLIVDKKFEEALAYLSVVPTEKMEAFHHRVFDADGAEIIYGIMSRFYDKSDYSNLIKIWEKYKDKYINKVAKSPYLNYIVGNSYINLGLFDSFERELAIFEKLEKTQKRTFPLWVKRKNHPNSKALIEELKLLRNIKLKNFSLAMENIKRLEREIKSIKVSYWKGRIYFYQKNYKEAVKNFEVFLTNYNVKENLNVVEIAELIRAYTDSIYQMGDVDKFYSVSDAILADVKNIEGANPYLKEVKERTLYLQMEIILGKQEKERFLTLEPMVKSFLNKYPKSAYKERVEYIMGLSLIKNEKEERGKKIFEKILASESSPRHIKEMVRSELSLMRIKGIGI